MANKRNLIVLILILIALPVGIYLARRVTSPPSGAFGEAVTVSLMPDNAALPPNRYISVNINAKTNKIGYARVKIHFDTSKIRLSSEAIQTNTLATVLEKTPMEKANMDGTLVLALGLASFDKSNPPTGTFEIARLPFTAITSVKNDITLITLDPSDIQIVEMNDVVLPKLIANVTVNLNTSVLPTPAGEGSIALGPQEDTYVSKYDAGKNFGGSTTLSVDSGTRTEITYLKFNLAQLAGKAIDTAVLRYRICSSSDCPSGAAQDVHIVATSNWSEMGMTWNNRPAVGQIIASEDGGEAGAWKSMDVSAGIQGHEGSMASLAFTQSSEDGLAMYSRESASAPQLVIKYADGVINPTGSLTIQPTQDAWVNRDLPNSNYSADRQLSVRNGMQMMTYVSFDLSRLGGKTVKTAKLRMHICTSTNCGSGGTQNIRTVTEPWTEQSIVFTNKPATGAIVGHFGGGSTGKWLESDVLAGVTGKEGEEMVTFEIDQSSLDGIYFDSREAGSSVAPQLVITYE